MTISYCCSKVCSAQQATPSTSLKYYSINLLKTTCVICCFVITHKKSQAINSRKNCKILQHPWHWYENFILFWLSVPSIVNVYFLSPCIIPSAPSFPIPFCISRCISKTGGRMTVITVKSPDQCVKGSVCLKLRCVQNNIFKILASYPCVFHQVTLLYFGALSLIYIDNYIWNNKAKYVGNIWLSFRAHNPNFVKYGYFAFTDLIVPQFCICSNTAVLTCVKWNL